MTRRVGKGADQERMLFQACKRSAVPTRHESTRATQDRVGTAHDGPYRAESAGHAPLPTLQRCDSLRSAA